MASIQVRCRLLLAALLVLAMAMSTAWAQRSGLGTNGGTISGGPKGALASADVTWLANNKVTLTNVQLKDTACDGHAVYFTARLNGGLFDVPDSRRSDASGCKEDVIIKGMSITDSARLIKSIRLLVCVQKAVFDDCVSTQNSFNIYD